jgi:hypothetical protein
LKIKGFADRIDELFKGNEKTIRIVDYKTGSFIKKPKNQKATELINEFEFLTYDKNSLEIIKNTIISVQFPAYILMAEKKYPADNYEAKIYALGRNDSGIEENIKGNMLDFYHDILKYLLNHMKFCETLFALPDENCKYCEFSIYCKFSKTS